MTEQKESFGERLRKLRKAAGLTQKEMAEEIGVSRRIIDYYERESRQPPSYFLAELAKTLNISIDELLGIKAYKQEAPKLGSRLEKRLREVEKLDPKTKKQILQVLDILIDASQRK